jgi:hypothetical protein
MITQKEPLAAEPLATKMAVSEKDPDPGVVVKGLRVLQATSTVVSI